MKQQKNMPLPYYGVTVLWLLLIVLQPSAGVILEVIISIGVFTLLRLIQPDQPPVPRESVEIQTQTESDINHVFQRGDVAIFNLRQVMEQIQNSEVRTTIAQLELLGGKILNEVENRPEKLQQIETFVDYYLPTTLNILNAYHRAEATGIEGENINRTKHQIEDMLNSSILVVFHKQLDSLFGSDVLDISVELSVLESMMAREGISGERMEAETTKNADGSDIKLTL
ncbi:MAG: 5-bromo-4-chloroindolyl phosphate hydrolysis family protein [Oscillospiraceae bacterium]|nr:5-bromo-4-chloroindolyl phosphate hydrolysis family protein [Oscillospiraceae bacterium]